MVHGLSDVILQSTRHRGNIAWLARNDIRTSSYFALSIRNVNGFNDPIWLRMDNIHLLYNETIVDLCFGCHGVLLNSTLNYIDLRSASVNMKFTGQ